MKDEFLLITSGILILCAVASIAVGTDRVDFYGCLIMSMLVSGKIGHD